MKLYIVLKLLLLIIIPVLVFTVTSRVFATAATISDISVSASQTAATVSWTTDQAAKSYVDYGTASGDYADTVYDTTLVTSHSLSISGLTAGTTYYYRVQSVNSGNEITQSSESTFTTSSASSPTSTPTPTSTTTTTTTTVTRIITSTPLPSPTPDKTPPSINLKTDFTRNYTEAPFVSGSVSDVSGVASLEYSIDNGLNWLAVDTISNIYGNSTSYSFNPPPLLDGTYKLKIKASDGKGNSGSTKAYNLTIDRLPPRVGSAFLTYGPQVITPDDNGNISITQGSKIKLFLSAVGGPNSIDLLAYPAASDIYSASPLSMKKNPETGIWATILDLKNPGLFEIATKSVDGAQNYVEKKLNAINVLPRGIVLESPAAPDNQKPVKNAAISVYFLDPITNLFIFWDPSSYNLENPVLTDNTGQYSLFLPPGTYYLVIGEKNLSSVRSEIFTLNKSTWINSDFQLSKRSALSLGYFNLKLPQLLKKEVPVKLKINAAQIPSPENDMIGLPLPDFNLKTGNTEINQFAFRTSPSVLTFVNTWLPDVGEIINNLNPLYQENKIKMAVFIPHQSIEDVFLWKTRGNYQIPIIADPDGNLSESLNISSLPVNFFINRQGIITGVQKGVLNRQKLLDNLIR